MKVTIERAIEGIFLVEEGFDSKAAAYDFLEKIHHGYQCLVKAGLAKPHCQYQIRDENDEVVFRWGSI